MKIILYSSANQLPFGLQPGQPTAVFDLSMASFERSMCGTLLEKDKMWPVLVGLHRLHLPGAMAHVSLIVSMNDSKYQLPEFIMVQITTEPEGVEESGFPSIRDKQGNLAVTNLWSQNPEYSHPFAAAGRLASNPDVKIPRFWTEFFRLQIEQACRDVEYEHKRALKRIEEEKTKLLAVYDKVLTYEFAVDRTRTPLFGQEISDQYGTFVLRWNHEELSKVKKFTFDDILFLPINDAEISGTDIQKKIIADGYLPLDIFCAHSLMNELSAFKSLAYKRGADRNFASVSYLFAGSTVESDKNDDDHVVAIVCSLNEGTYMTPFEGGDGGWWHDFTIVFTKEFAAKLRAEKS